MSSFNRCALPLTVLFCLTACVHTRDIEMTAEEHRAEAARRQAIAERERAKYDENALRPQIAPRGPFVETDPTLRYYNPTAPHLEAADRNMLQAFEHLRAAQRLEKFENEACTGISIAERTACPLLAPHVARVVEMATGVALELKPTAPAQTLSTQMRCHLAFAEANGFEKVPCPLYVKGVEIRLRKDGAAIEVVSFEPQVAGQVRAEARKMFAQPLNVSTR